MVRQCVKDNNMNLSTLQESADPFYGWEQRLEHALRNLGDRTALNKSPLTKLIHIKKLAAGQYNGHLLPRGLALHDVLLACVDKVSRELGEEPKLARACIYLRLHAEGLSCREISKRLGLSREHISRVYRKKAIELVTEEFLSVVNNGR